MQTNLALKTTDRPMPDTDDKKRIKLEFARRLQEALDAKGWTATELARKGHAKKEDGRYAISRYLKGEVLPRPDQLELLAKALGKTPSDLLPTRGVPLAEHEDAPDFDIKSAGEGLVRLRVNQIVKYEIALEVMGLLGRKQ